MLVEMSLAMRVYPAILPLMPHSTSVVRALEATVGMVRSACLMFARRCPLLVSRMWNATTLTSLLTTGVVSAPLASQVTAPGVMTWTSVTLLTPVTLLLLATTSSQDSGAALVLLGIQGAQASQGWGWTMLPGRGRSATT